MLPVSGSKKNLFSVERRSFHSIYKPRIIEEMRTSMPQLYIKKQKKRWDYISFSMKYVYWWLKCSCFEFFGGKKCGVFESKSWWKYDIYSLRKSYCFDLFGNGKYGLFEPKCWWKDVIYWLLKSSCFELFDDRKYGLFLNQEVDGEMIFTD